jgi:hypothetical protein
VRVERAVDHGADAENAVGDNADQENGKGGGQKGPPAPTGEQEGEDQGAEHVEDGHPKNVDVKTLSRIA